MHFSFGEQKFFLCGITQSKRISYPNPTLYFNIFCSSPGNGSNGKRDTDTTQLLAALESSELAGAVSMSYTLLLHQGAPTRPRMTPGIAEQDIHTVPPPPGERTASIVRSTLLLINAVARVDHQALQVSDSGTFFRVLKCSIAYIVEVLVLCHMHARLM